jgi:hypothetical protein
MQPRRSLPGASGRGAFAGFYRARDPQAGAELLRRACRVAAREGARWVLGPVDGGTWGNYRLPLTLPEAAGIPGAEPRFWGEPRGSPEEVAAFQEAGFALTAEYESRLIPRPQPREGAVALASRWRRQGYRIRTAERTSMAAELPRILALAERAFAGAPYHAPAPPGLLQTRYAALLPYLDPRLVPLVEDACGNLAAFALALGPDEHERVILKTLAADPAGCARGASALLADAVHRAAEGLGARAVVHALMRTDNATASVSRRYGGHVVRRYGLFRWVP